MGRMCGQGPSRKQVNLRFFRTNCGPAGVERPGMEFGGRSSGDDLETLSRPSFLATTQIPTETHKRPIMQFDEYAANYKELVDKSSGVSVEALAAEKARLIEGILRRVVGDPKELSILDVGCGIGLVERSLQNLVKSLHGIDTSSASIAYARDQARSAEFHEYGGEGLPFDSNRFDGASANFLYEPEGP